MDPAKVKSKSYNDVPSTNLKIIDSPGNAPSVRGVAVSSPQTAKDCWPPIKSAEATDELPTINPSGEMATIYGESEDLGS